MYVKNRNFLKLINNYKIVEVKKKFEVMSGKNGNLTLSYKFPGKIGLLMTSFFIFLSLITLLLNKKYNI